MWMTASAASKKSEDAPFTKICGYAKYVRQAECSTKKTLNTAHAATFRRADRI